MSNDVELDDLDGIDGMSWINTLDEQSDSDISSGLFFDELDHEDKSKVRSQLRKFKKGFSG